MGRESSGRRTEESHGTPAKAPSELPEGAEFASGVKNALLQLLAEQSESIIMHLAHVADLATSTAKNLGLSPAQVALTRLGAELHDVGKVGIPGSILDKPGPLNLEEQWFVQRHSEMGERIVAAVPDMQIVAPIVRAVHERPDGRGYPDGLELDEIPISARIIAVVDAFDAMTTNRPYQESVPVEQAVAELRRHAGTQFDPKVVEAFVTTIHNRLSTRAA
jgi:HD-GYP domain-containing protein (c-di-GMP phosphodiesterase class II)